jgi:hypothetical protein
MSEDKSIREKILKKDKDFSEGIKKEMIAEENMLKGYFKEYKKPVGEDPTVISNCLIKPRKGTATRRPQVAHEGGLRPFQNIQIVL